MIAVFYDRKHGCEVTSDQLMPVNFVREVVTGNSYEPEEKGLMEDRIGEFGYKSPTCQKYQNWDRPVMYTDLVFIRLALSEAEEKEYEKEDTPTLQKPTAKEIFQGWIEMGAVLEDGTKLEVNSVNKKKLSFTAVVIKGDRYLTKGHTIKWTHLKNFVWQGMTHKKRTGAGNRILLRINDNENTISIETSFDNDK